MIYLTRQQQTAMMISAGAYCQANGQHPYWLITRHGIFCPTCGSAPILTHHNHPIIGWILRKAQA